MELRHLHYFVVLAEKLHFSAAAEKLGIAAPTLSVQIKQLEESIGVELFTRTKRSVSLTQAGALFLVEANATLVQAERAREIGRLASRGEVGHLGLGYVSSALWSGILSKLLSQFRKQNLNVTITPREYPMNELPVMVSEGKLDIAFIRSPIRLPDDIKSLHIQQDIFCAALPAAHPLAGREQPVEPFELRNEKFILPEQPHGTVEVARRGGFKVKRSESPGSLVDVLSRVSFNEGVAVVPDVLSNTVFLPEVVYRPLAAPAIPSEINIIYRKWERSPTVLNFIDFTRDLFAS